jgi:hypothetical protein
MFFTEMAIIKGVIYTPAEEELTNAPNKHAHRDDKWTIAVMTMPETANSLKQ